MTKENLLLKFAGVKTKKPKKPEKTIKSIKSEKLKHAPVNKMSKEERIKFLKKQGFIWQTDFTLNLNTGKSKEYTIWTHSEIKEKRQLKEGDPNVTKAIREDNYKSITGFKSHKF